MTMLESRVKCQVLFVCMNCYEGRVLLCSDHLITKLFASNFCSMSILREAVSCVPIHAVSCAYIPQEEESFNRLRCLSGVYSWREGCGCEMYRNSL